MTERKVKAGTMVIEQGAVGDYYYVVLEGVYEVLANGQKVAEITTGGAFGEAALMTDTPRKASVRARIDGILWCVDRITFRRFVLKEQVIEQKHQEEVHPISEEVQQQQVQPQLQE
jgi:cAMP-dependent protein kinase regulator